MYNIDMQVNYGFGYLPEDYPKHSHNDWEIHFFTKGEGFYCSENEAIPIRRNHLFISAPEEQHHILVQDPLVFHFIRIQDPGEEKPLFTKLVKDSHSKKGFVLDEEFHYMLENIRLRGNQPESHAKAAALFSLLALLHGLYIKSAREPVSGGGDPVTRGILYLRQHIREKVSLDDLAAVVNLNKHHFSRLFREKTGLPPIDYFLHMKLDAAAWLLRESEWGQKEITEHLSLGDVYYFSRLFKKKRGQTPRDYRHNKG